jgi:outer membrane lipoprotein-sorting protein
MKKILLIISVAIFLIACVEPRNIKTREKYQEDHNWCMDYSIHPKIKSNRPYNTQRETYRECMEWLGYNYN